MEIVASGHLEFDNALNLRSARRLTLDLSLVDHINIYGLVGVACAVMDAKKRGLVISIHPPTYASASNFMSRLGFDRFVAAVAEVSCDLPFTSAQGPENILVELGTFSSSRDLLPLQDLLASRLEGIAHPQARAALEEALWELGANVTEHAVSEGVVAAFVQRAARRSGAAINFAIGDAGVGLLQSFLRGTSGYHPSSDHEAITLALQYLVSSVDDPGRGQGLSITARQALELNGRVTVRSGTARRSISARPPKGVELHQAGRAQSVPRLDGTIVAVSIPCR